MANEQNVTAIMITGKVPERYPLAQASLEAFRRQEGAPNARLLILSEFEQPLLTADEPNIVEMQLTPQRGRTLGDLRNMGMDMCETRYAVQWDDDDFSHKDRLRYQLDSTDFDGEELTLFEREIHCNLKNPTEAFINHGGVCRVKGFAGTMMFPVGKHYFPAIGKHEDTEFVLAFKRRRVLPNPPDMYLRFYHGHNTWDEKHVMKPKPGSEILTPSLRRYVDSIIEEHYASFDPPA